MVGTEALSVDDGQRCRCLSRVSVMNVGVGVVGMSLMIDVLPQQPRLPLQSYI